MIRARSSESSLTIVLIVEYKMGLRHPAAPRKYHAINLKKSAKSSPGNAEPELTDFSPVGTFQIIMTIVENKQNAEAIVKMIHSG
jgi:hypothetical protein